MSRSLTYRLVTHVVTMTMFDELPIRCRSLFLDSSDISSGLSVPDRFAAHLPDFGGFDADVPREVYEYWVLERGGEALALVHDGGRAWGPAGVVDVGVEYARRRRVADVAAALLGTSPEPVAGTGLVNDGLDSVRAAVQQVVQTHQEFGAQSFKISFESNRHPGVECYVQGQIVEPWLHLDAVSNQFLPAHAALADTQVKALEALGWGAPVPGNGNENFSLFLHLPGQLADASNAIVDALVRGYGATGRDHWSAQPAEAVTSDLLGGAARFVPDSAEHRSTPMPVEAEPISDGANLRSQSGAQVRLVAQLSDLAGRLRAEPLAAIMYGSLELFHSNLLAWFFKAFPQAAEEVFASDLPPGIQETRDVQREHRDLDLIMTFPGKERLAIENKVFSVPTVEQLDRYRHDVLDPWEAQGLGSSTAVLLSVFKPNWIDSLPGWTFLGYDELADRIEHAMARTPSSYEAETVDRYTRVIRVLAGLAEAVIVQDLGEPADLPLELETAVGDEKLAMRLRKFRAHCVAETIAAETKDHGGSAKGGFSKGQPLIEWFRNVPMNSVEIDGAVGWQMQGGDFRRALIVSSSLSGPENLDARRAFAAEHEEWFDFAPIDPIFGSEAAAVRPALPADGSPRGFNKYDPNFLYRAKKVARPTVQQLIDATHAIVKSVETS
ncbi:PD-(D/E)XK nuclease superfamily [Promicromonospora umidemergens]|nr:PD-(D/E)XK nuclease superfamily [Promicromonospora umidemergens]